MIKLSKRLSVIAGMINISNVLADIGCDHALLDIYLLQNKKIKKSIACDIKEGALNQAHKNVKLHDIKNIDLRLSNGLNKIKKEDKVDTLVISGLGDVKIISILKEGLSKLKDINQIIIQSNTQPNKIRRYLTSINYYINDEALIIDNNIIYTIISFKKGYKKYSKKELEFGPILINKNDDLFKIDIRKKINKNKNIIRKINNKNMIKKMKLVLKNIYLKKLIK